MAATPPARGVLQDSTWLPASSLGSAVRGWGCGLCRDCSHNQGLLQPAPSPAAPARAAPTSVPTALLPASRGARLLSPVCGRVDPAADPRTRSGPDHLPVGLPRVRNRPVRGVHLQKQKTPHCWLVCPFLFVPPWCPEPHGDAAPSVNTYVRTDGKVKGS